MTEIDDILDEALEEYTLEVVDPIAADGIEERTVIRNKAKAALQDLILREKLAVHKDYKDGFSGMVAKYADQCITELQNQLKKIEHEEN